MNGPGATEMVREFHEKFGCPMSDLPRTVGAELAFQRQKMLASEVYELRQAALGGGTLPEIAREIADVVYVAYGTALTYGIDLDAVLAEVHRANMTKSAGDTVDGKVQKGEGYRRPDVAAVLERQKPQPENGPWYGDPHRVTAMRFDDSLDLHYEVEHPHGCDRLPYGQRCMLDMLDDRSGWPGKEGVYTISAWSGRTWTDQGWEYDAGVQWEPVE